MSIKKINTIGFAVGIAWFVIVVSAGWHFFEILAVRFGDAFGALSLFYMFAAVGVLFLGRALLEQILVAILNLGESTSSNTIKTETVATLARSLTGDVIVGDTIIATSVLVRYSSFSTGSKDDKNNVSRPTIVSSNTTLTYKLEEYQYG